MKKRLIAAAMAALCCLALGGCSFSDVMLYLYGGDDFVEKETEPAYALYHGENGVEVVYDQNTWAAPEMAQPDTVSVMAGGSMDATMVLLQVTDSYTDFLTQSGEELSAETNTVRYDYEFTVPNAAVAAVRYDCGSYQTIFAQLDYDSGETVYVTAATKLGDESLITGLLQNVYPEGHAPDTLPEVAAGA